MKRSGFGIEWNNHIIEMNQKKEHWMKNYSKGFTPFVLNMSKRVLEGLREKLQEALDNADLSSFGNVSVSLGRMRYEREDIFPVSVSLEVANKSEDGSVLSSKAKDFQRNAHLYGLKSEMLGQTFVCNGKTFTITGLNTRARKMPIQANDENGSGYKFTADQVVRFMSDN